MSVTKKKGNTPKKEAAAGTPELMNVLEAMHLGGVSTEVRGNIVLDIEAKIESGEITTDLESAAEIRKAICEHLEITFE